MRFAPAPVLVYYLDAYLYHLVNVFAFYLRVVPFPILF